VGVRHDEIGLEVLLPPGVVLRFGKTKRRICGIVRAGALPGPCPARFLEVHGFRGPDAEHDSQNFNVRDPLRHGGIEAGAALLRWCRKWKPARVLQSL